MEALAHIFLTDPIKVDLTPLGLDNYFNPLTFLWGEGDSMWLQSLNKNIFL